MLRFVLFKKFLLILAVCGLTGCMVGPDFRTPDSPQICTYTEVPLPEKTVGTEELQSSAEQVFLEGLEVPADWWVLFHSDDLNILIEQGLENNPNIRAAVATLCQEKRHFSALCGSIMYPEIGGELFGGRERFSSFDNFEGSPDDTLAETSPQQLTFYNTNFSATYNLDVFGGNRRAMESLRAQVHYACHQLESTVLAVIAEICTTVIEEASLRKQIQATQSLIKLAETKLGIIEKQFKLGSVSQLDLIEQRTVLAQSRATLAPLQDSLAKERHSLAVLVGAYPDSAMLPEFDLDLLHLPTELPVSIPCQFVRQHPDIRAAEALLHQATADIGVATANLLPSFPLTGTIGANSNKLKNFFTPNNIFWDWQVGILQTIFNGGALREERKAAIEGFKVACAEYQGVVLAGVQNVADSLSSLQSDARVLYNQLVAENSAKETLLMVQRMCTTGGANYLELLDAETQFQEMYLERISAQAARYSDTVSLFQSLGGGWWNRE